MIHLIADGGTFSNGNALGIRLNTSVANMNEISTTDFSVYPNPANSQINVKADSKMLGSIYTVYDNTGRIVLSGKINSEKTVIELGNLQSGIYRLSAGDNYKETFKIIKD